MPVPRATGLVRQGLTDFAPFLISDYPKRIFSKLPNTLCTSPSRTAQVHDQRTGNPLKSVAYYRTNLKVCWVNRVSDGKTNEPRPWDTDPTPLQLALARAHCWLAMLETGQVKSLKEIAENEGIVNSYVSRMVNLTTLAPDIVEAILDDQLPPTLTLFDLAVDPPKLWSEQRKKTGF